MKLSIEELKLMRDLQENVENHAMAQALDELIAIRELKGDQVPVGKVVAWNHPNEERKIDFRFLRFDVQPGTQLFTAPQKPVVLPDKIPDALYQLLFDECGGFVECDLNTNKVWQAFKALAAGGIVKDGE